MNTTITDLERIVKEGAKEQNLNLKALPTEEGRVFLNVIKQFDKFSSNFDPSWITFNKNELQKWGFIYILLHDLFHLETNQNDIVKLEIFATAPVFEQIQKIISPDEYRKLVTAYFILGYGSLKINHSLPYLVSEKIILGEFVSIGGVEQGLWGIKLKEELLNQVAKNVIEKTKKDKHHLLLKKYKNFVFDFIT